jgi:hypothetical protein
MVYYTENIRGYTIKVPHETKEVRMGKNELKTLVIRTFLSLLSLFNVHFTSHSRIVRNTEGKVGRERPTSSINCRPGCWGENIALNQSYSEQNYLALC